MMDELVPYGESLPVSKSPLWDIQAEYYRRKGLDAWQEIPYYVTGSRVMAEVYADLIVALCKDVSPRLEGRTLNILELGAGLGRLGFHLCQVLPHKLNRFRSTRNLAWKLTLSDMTDDVLNFWRTHSGFAPHVESGHLAFAKHPELPVDEPLVVIANYLFDSLPHDEFLIDDHRLNECYIQLMRNPGDGPPELSEIRYRKTYQPVTTYHHYPHLAWNRILRDYRAEARSGAFLFPRAALEILGQWVGKEFALLSSDRGFTALKSMVCYPEHPYERHAGAFSHMVNYDAIARWFRNGDGHAWMTRDGVFNSLQTVCCLSSKWGKGPFEEVNHVFEERLQRANVVNSAHALFAFVRNRAEHLPLAYRSFLRLNACDPDALVVCAKAIGETVETLTPTECDELLSLLEEVAKNIYLHPGVTRAPFWLGYIYTRLGMHEKARQYLQMTVGQFGPDDMLMELLRQVESTQQPPAG